MKEDASISTGLKKKVGELLKRVNWLGLGKAAVSSFFPLLAMFQGNESLLKNPEEIPGKTLELIGDFEEEFKELTNEYVGDGGRLVVFIDDLDRCIPKKTVDILEAIKVFLNVQHSVFVIGADRDRIVEGIIARYGEKSESWAGKYLEKIVQIPFSVPPLRKGIIRERFIPGLDSDFKNCAHIIAEVSDNPRTIKRFLNHIKLKIKVMDKGEQVRFESITGDKEIVKIAVIDFRWHAFYSDLVKSIKTGINLADELKMISESDEAERKEKFKERADLGMYFEDKSLIIFLEQDPPVQEDALDIYNHLTKSVSELERNAFLCSLSAKFCESEEKYDEAIVHYDKVIELTPNDGWAWYGKGRNLEKLGRKKDAERCFQKAKELGYEES